MLTDNDKIKATAMKNLGISIRDMAKYLKIPKSTIWDYLNISKNKKDKSKLLIISDLHSGHLFGLTHPNYFSNKNSRPKEYLFQKELWEWFAKKIDEIGEVDYLLINGDCIDGKGKKSGGTELLTNDLIEQVDIATKCIEQIKFNEIFITVGTAYHVGSDGNDIEQIIADNFDTNIYENLNININGCYINMRHFVGSTSIISSRSNALIKAYQANREIESIPNADVFIRSHVHYSHVVMSPKKYLAMTTPSLQGNSKFGSRICQGDVDIGIVEMNIPNNYNNVQDINYKIHLK